MKPEHTPSPWSSECALSSDMYNIRYITGPDGQKICDVSHRVEMSQTEALANARLIKALPDLLEALQELMAWQVKNVNCWSNPAYDKAARVLAKVTGENT